MRPKDPWTVTAYLGKPIADDGPKRDYLVTVFKRLKAGDLYALVLRTTSRQPIEWVRAHVDEIVALGIQKDPIAKLPQLPIVALNVEYA